MIIKRIAQKTLEYYIDNCGAVLVTGPKYCGKTFLSKSVSKSQYFIKYKDTSKYGSYNMNDILTGDYPRLIDEWQEFPEVWDEIRHIIDMMPPGEKNGLYILTGSTKPFDDGIRLHSGAGRIYTMNLATLTFAEILNLNETNSLSLHELANNNASYKFMRTNITPHDINNFMLMGGWPELHASEKGDYKLLLNKYIDTLVGRGIMSYNFNLSKDTLLKILKLIARVNGTQINKSSILREMDNEVSIETIDKYLNLLHDLDIIFDVFPWKNINLRSRYKIRTKPKTYFCDTSLVCRLLDINSQNDFFNDLNTTGIIFETQVMKDLTVYAQDLGAKIYFFRDEQDHEVDAIFEFDDGSWWIIEIKLADKELKSAVDKLNNIDRYITLDGKHTKPSLKLIITGGNSTNKMDGDLFIIPHALIRP